MFKRNPGRFKYCIKLMRPSKALRDDLGGIQETTYSTALTINAMCEQRSQSRQQIAGDYVSVDTRYFITRDLRGTEAGDIDTSWRIELNGRTYLINDVLLIDESVPAFVQITATAMSGGRL